MEKLSLLPDDEIVSRIGGGTTYTVKELKKEIIEFGENHAE